MMTLRPYQADAVNAVYDHLAAHDDNPCIVIPTAGGKTPVIATICRDAVTQWNGRVLILAHVKELLEQAVEKLHVFAPDLFMAVGVYSASLNKRQTDQPIIVAGIQSVYRRAAELGRFDLILIDEAHMIPPDGEGMYQTFLSESRIVNPNVRMIGLTATPYRATTGAICDEKNLLNTVCYESTVKELIVQGYLCPLKTRAGTVKVDTSGLRTRAGEFIPSETESLMNTDELVFAAVGEMVELTRERQSVLIFASGIEHARHIQRRLAAAGHECGFVSGETGLFERTDQLERFKKRQLKYLVNVNVLTTGFDAPVIDCVVLLRPTMSPGLYYQMVGRGFRLHEGKQDCLVLDYGGNILRHGPIDLLGPWNPGPKGDGDAVVKECEKCHAIVAGGYRICPECGTPFPEPEEQKLEATATDRGIMSDQPTDRTYDVAAVVYSEHVKKSDYTAPHTLRVDYTIGFNQYVSEWVCLAHPPGFAKNKAIDWWQARCPYPVPMTVSDAVAIAWNDGLAQPTRITVRTTPGDRFPRIVHYELPPVTEDGPRCPHCGGRRNHEDDDLGVVICDDCGKAVRLIVEPPASTGVPTPNTGMDDEIPFPPPDDEIPF